MKKFILPLAIILVLILSVFIINSIKNDEQPVENPSEIQNNTNEIIDQPKENTNVVSIYEQYNVEPGSYEAYLLNLYSGDSSFSGEDTDNNGIPDTILAPVKPIS